MTWSLFTVLQFFTSTFLALWNAFSLSFVNKTVILLYQQKWNDELQYENHELEESC
ncbi:hypothetical protein DCAR_0311488 [Daucus carota subsp. sativus]|uniref:Uncharacterized protein n=1 Tax=Daucus carota subsp. sativus TaxID=79200 RepID=A0A166AKT1_DAUCS|nr:hypothetical protein DCAR_0311488 [Daucus carota subsp. sativus]